MFNGINSRWMGADQAQKDRLTRVFFDVVRPQGPQVVATRTVKEWEVLAQVSEVPTGMHCWRPRSE